MGKGSARTGITLEILSKAEEEEHAHTELELLYVLDGSVGIYLEKERFILKREDILLIPADRRHRLCSGMEVLLCRLKLPYYEICSRVGEDFLLFECNSAVDSGERYGELQGLLHALLLAEIENDRQGGYKEDGLRLQIIGCLLDKFRVQTGNGEYQKSVRENRRLAYIMRYIHTNYRNGLSLSELSGRLFLSPSSLSRFFVKATGVSFVDYVKKLRLSKVAEELVETEEPVTRIAVDQGFSNPSVMNQAFRACYGMTPTEYRKQAGIRKAERAGNLSAEQREKLKRLLGERRETDRPRQMRAVMEADLSNRRRYHRWKNQMINVGSAYALSAADMQRQVLELTEQLGFPYIRLWNIFSKQFLICHGELKEPLHFDRLDSIFDFCVQHNLKLFLDLGARRDTAMVDLGNSLYSNEDGMEFSSAEEWEWMLEHFLRHLLRRYGKEIVESWVFEFTFFLNGRPYYGGEKYSSTQAWNISCGTVKRVLPDARVAGPGMLVWEDGELLEKVIYGFLNSLRKPDIFTVLLFPYFNYEVENEAAGKRITDPGFGRAYLDKVRDILTGMNYDGELYVTEWSNSISNRNYIQDSCYRGTYILESVRSLFPAVDAMGFWYASDLINVYYDSHNLLNGSSGLLTKDGICKPSFYAFRFLNDMGRYLVKTGENYLITAGEEQDITILCWNMAKLSPNYYLRRENRYEAGEVNVLFERCEEFCPEFVLLCSDEGTYVVRQKIINEDWGSVLDRWVELGCEPELSPEDIRYLRRSSQPKIEISRMRAEAGRLKLPVELKPHEMRWIHIFKEIR